MIRSFVALSLLMSASVAVAKTEGESAAAPGGKPAKEKKICRSDDSGTRLGKRICRTAKQWNDERSEADIDKVKQLGN
jgi:hypothetical protein